MVKLVINLLTAELTNLKNKFGDQKFENRTIKDQKQLGYLKKIKNIILQVPTRQTYKKCMWIIDTRCSRHMIGKKENFESTRSVMVDM